MTSRPGTTNEILEGLYESLVALSTPRVSQASIKFQIIFKIWGGSGAGYRER
jgi:hypothetical protein